MLACRCRGTTIYAIEEMRSGKIHKWHQAIITCKLAHFFPLLCLFCLVLKENESPVSQVKGQEKTCSHKEVSTE